MDNLSLEVEFPIDNDRLKRESAESKRIISGVGETAAETAERSNQRIVELIKTEEQAAKKRKAVFSDSQAEVDAYQKSLDGLKGKVAESGKAALISELNKDLQAGKITAEEFRKELERLNASVTSGSKSPNSPSPDSGAMDNYKHVLEDAEKSFSKLDAASQRSIIKLNDLQSELLEVSNAQKALNTAFDKGEIVGSKYAQNQAALAARERELKQELSATAIELQKQDQVAGNTTRRFNGLQNSINQISRELPAFTYSAQTGFMAVSNNIPILADEIGRLKKQNEELVASGQKGTPVWKSLITSFFSWGTALSLGITLITVYGKEIGEFFKGLFKGKESVDALKKSQESLNKAFDGADYKKAITNVSELRQNLKLAKEGLISKNEVVKQYNESIGKVAGEVKTLDEVEKAMVKNADNYVQMMFYKAAATAALEEASKHAVEAAKKMTQTDDEASGYLFSGDGAKQMKNKDGRTIQQTVADNRRKLQSEEEKKHQNTMLGIAEDFQRKYAIISKKSGFKLLSDKKEQTKAESKEYENLLQKITDLDREYARKEMSSDQAELQALRDKFKKIEEEITRFNAKKRNKVKIDVGQLNPIQKKAEEDLLYKQDTEKLKTELDKQKAIFQQYESYKEQVNKESADKRFESDKAAFDNYGDYLKSKLSEFEGLDVSTLSKTQRERYDRLKKDSDEYDNQEKLKQDKRFIEALQASSTFEQKKLDIEKKYNNLKMALPADGSYIERSKELDRQQQEEINSAKDTAFQKTEIYKKLAEDTLLFTRESLKKEIQAAENLLKSDLTPELRSEIEKQLSDLKVMLKIGVDESNVKSLTAKKSDLLKTLNDPLVKGTESAKKYKKELAEVQKQIDEIQTQKVDKMQEIASNAYLISDSFGKWAEALSDSNSELANTMSSIAGVSDLLGDYWTANANIAKGVLSGDPKAIIDGIKGLIDFGAKLFSLNKKTKQMNEAARAEQKKFYDEAIKGEMEYQALLRKRERDDAARGKNSYKALIAQLDVLKTQSKPVEDAYNRIFRSLQGQEFISDVGYEHGTWFRKAKTWDIMASLAGADYDKMEKLFTEGKLKDQAKADFEALRGLREELKQAGIDVEDLTRQLNEMLTGTSASGLSDTLTQLFQNGKMAAQDFGKSFEDIMKNAITNSFKYKVMEDALTPFYNELADMMKAGIPSENQIAGLKDKWTNVSKDLENQFNQWESITGIGLRNEDSASSKTMSKSIESITQQQADVLAGQVGGIHLAVVQNQTLHKNTYAELQSHTGLLKQSYMVQMEIAENTKRTANNTDRLFAVEKHLESINNKMNSDAAIRAGGGRI